MKKCLIALGVAILTVGFGCTDQDDGITMPGPAFETIGEPYLLFKCPADPGDSYIVGHDSVDPLTMQVLSIDSSISVPGGDYSCYSYQERSSYYVDAPFYNYHLAPWVGFVGYEVIDTLGGEYFTLIWELEGIDIPIGSTLKRGPSEVIMPLRVGWRWRGVQTAISYDDTISGSYDFFIMDTVNIDGEKWYLLESESPDRKSAMLKGAYPIYANRADGLWQWLVKF
jgi:hypothetical protein